MPGIYFQLQIVIFNHQHIKMEKRKLLILLVFLAPLFALSQDLYKMRAAAKSRVITFENPTGGAGKGGMENKGAKGHANDIIKRGQTQVLMNYTGNGILQRIWCTIDKRTPQMLRALRLQMFWDNSTTPAVDVPFGDFFGIGLGQKVPFQSALFSDPEGRSFNCNIPMPFRKNARVLLINEGNEDVNLFYEIDVLETSPHAEDVLYFQAYWSRKVHTELGKDFEFLPTINGRGRFLGVNAGVIADTSYPDTWWGEGEVKMYLDGDKNFATIVGTGTEDYIGTAWGLGAYANNYQGSPIADEKKKIYAFYRYHIPDEIYFNSSIRVTIQELGGGTFPVVKELVRKGAKIQPVTIARNNSFVKLLEQNPVPSILDDPNPDGWVNFYRIDDYSSCAYFYLNRPAHGLPKLQSVEERVRDLR